MDRNKAERVQCERAAVVEYEKYLGKQVHIKTIQGYRDDNNSHYYECNRNVLVEVILTPMPDIIRWMDDEHLDPIWNVRVIERGNLPKDLRSCWIYGSTQRPYKSPQLGDVIINEDSINKLKDKLLSIVNDVYNDFDEEEIKSQPKSIQLLWETWRDVLNEF